MPSNYYDDEDEGSTLFRLCFFFSTMLFYMTAFAVLVSSLKDPLEEIVDTIDFVSTVLIFVD